MGKINFKQRWELFLKLPKNNWFNRNILRRKTVKRLQALKPRLEQVISFILSIGDVTYEKGDFDSAKVTGADSLLVLLGLHQGAWAAGFQHPYIGPDELGLFRTEVLPTMKPEEVFLGNIYGLWSKDIPTWEKTKNDGKSSGAYEIYDYLTVYQIILRQYKHHLTTNLKFIVGEEDPERKLKQLVERGY